MRKTLKDAKVWRAALALGTLGSLLWLTRRRSYSLPAESLAPLESEAGCDLSIKPGVAMLRDYVLARFGGYDAGILRDCALGGASGHKLGKAWDWGIDNGSADVEGFLDWLFANDSEMLRRAGITYLIYNRRIWNTRAQAWQTYTGADPHTSHVHISFGTPGALGQTSFYTEGRV